MNQKDLALMIIKYWYLLEFLGQPNFPMQSKEGKEICQKVIQENTNYKQITLYRTIPWEKQNTYLLSPNRILVQDASIYSGYRILSDEVHLCLGKMERVLFTEKLLQAFDLDIKLPEKNRRQVCLIGLKCDETGKYILGSFNLSPLVWGIDQLLKNKERLTKVNMANYLSINDYNTTMQQLECLLIEHDTEEQTGKELTTAVLDLLMEEVKKQYLSLILEPGQIIEQDGVMIYRRYQSEDVKAKDNDIFRDSELCNSFFADDLHLAEQIISENTFGTSPSEKALLDYITGIYAEESPELNWIDFSKRIDIFNVWNDKQSQQQADFFHNHLDISKAPLGKWPSKFMPCFMQQLAINLSWQPSPNYLPIFSVNGPPGTGKTTLLKEVVAGNVVERACLLAKYKDPDDAFVQKYFQDGDKKHQGYSQYCWGYFDFVDDQLKDYGMLVASCNNAAVENITKELPNYFTLNSGLEADKEEESSIAKGLLEVQELFQTAKAAQEYYDVWNSQLGKFELHSYPDIYFTKLANNLARKPDGEWDRWGLISAPFGKVSNLKEYMYGVLRPYIKSFGKNDSLQQHKVAYFSAVQRFQQQLYKVKQLEEELHIISGARKQFFMQEKAFRKEANKYTDLLDQQAMKSEKLLENIEQLHLQWQQEQQVLLTHQVELTVLQEEYAAQEQVKEALEAKKQAFVQKIIELERSQGFWDWLLKLFKRPTMLSITIEEYNCLLQQTKQQLQQQEAVVKQLLQHLIEQQEKCKNKQIDVARCKDKQVQLLEEQQDYLKQSKQYYHQVQNCMDQITEAHGIYKKVLQMAKGQLSSDRMTILDQEFFDQYNSQDEMLSTQAQIANPWQTSTYNREREKLFYEALQLHKAFLLGSKACLWNFKNLLMLWKEPGDDDKTVIFSRRDQESAFASLLNTVFLLTPVLSTTFASAGNMLSSIRRPREIGCLIIDEAGQATPQMAIGSLLRCRRAIVVGDPKQVEPVVTDEMDLIKQVIQNEVTSYYQSKTHSVQGFADRLNSVGTCYVDNEQKTWVGCPLVVHRRCISPMFELSNALSYNNIMKQQTAPPPREKELKFCRESSGWINISGSEKNTANKDHFVEAQGKKAWALILKAFQQNEGMPNLFIITPFTTVRDGMKKMIRSQPEYQKDKRFTTWMDKHIGTVHTFQGREADEVIFLLGCDKNAASAVRWVNTNIVNVAVTRAKYRLYVIGDYTVWQQSPLFQKVKGILDSYALRSLQKIAECPDAEQDSDKVEQLFKQTPDTDSLTLDGELDDRLVAPLFAELEHMWKDSTLTVSQMSTFNLTETDLENLPSMIRQRFVISILLHDLFKTIQEQYHLHDIDVACSSILFCKTMESLLKEVLLAKMRTFFPEVKIFGKKLCDLPENKITTGTFTHLLENKENQSQLAARKVKLFDHLCDLCWWEDYAYDLEAFRKLRNLCCHSEPFTQDQEEALLRILFEKREFIKTLVGNVL